MAKTHSLDELIGKKAAEFAEQVRHAAEIADKEEEIRIEVETQLAFIRKEAGVEFESFKGKQEFTVAKGRIDSLYNRVLIEYKNPSDSRFAHRSPSRFARQQEARRAAPTANDQPQRAKAMAFRLAQREHVRNTTDWRSPVKEQLERFVKQVKEWHQDCRGNEQATKSSLIAPLFGILGYNMHDPRECKPEYRMDFGKGEKAATPVDWAFLIDRALVFFVEAKEAGAKIARYPEQLRMYFGKQAGANGVKLGVLTNGAQWLLRSPVRKRHGHGAILYLGRIGGRSSTRG